jgi:hypothetical protein
MTIPGESIPGVFGFLLSIRDESVIYTTQVIPLSHLVSIFTFVNRSSSLRYRNMQIMLCADARR